jgi:hypothetical protein
MFGSDILEVAIGMAFVFLLASLVCTAIKEGIESVLNQRARLMRQAIEKMLSGLSESKTEPGKATDSTQNRVSDFYKHPLIECLCSSAYQEGKHRNLPGYIPSSSFSQAVIELIRKQATLKPDNDGTTAPGLTGAKLQEMLQALPPGDFKDRLTALLKDSQADLSAAKAALEQWFNQSMEQVGNYYKVHTQLVILGIALVVTLSLNINAMTIAQRLSTDTALRKVLVAQAEAESKMLPPGGRENHEGLDDRAINPPSTGTNPLVIPRSSSSAKTNPPNKDGEKPENPIEQIKKLGLPIGWEAFEWPKTWLQRLSLIGGWLGTVFSISLGAPFWFDTLSRIIQVRAALKPKADEAEPTAKNSTEPNPKPAE